MDGEHIYFICGDADRIHMIKEYFGDTKLEFSATCSTDGDISYQDLLETRRKLTDCEIVVVFVNEAFNYRSELQYELAVAILLEKDSSIITDGTSLSTVFEYDFSSIIDLGEDSEWIQNMRESIIDRRPQRKSKAVASSRKDVMLQCIWREEERSINDLIEKMEMKSHQMELDMNKSEAFSAGKDKVSHSFLCSLLTQSQENINSKVNQIPKDIKELCKRHQKMINKCHIRQIGRHLDLDDHYLDVVDSFYEHGIPEMFWQLVKIWHEVFPDRVSARKLRKALKSCNINTEEVPMPPNHKGVLTEMTDYLVENIVDINMIMPQLISQKVLNDVTKAYVTAPPTRDQRIMRLLEVITTKEHGLYIIVDVFKKTGNDFLVDKLIEKLPELKEDHLNKPSLAVSPSPRSSFSSELSLKLRTNYTRLNSEEWKQHHLSLNRFHQLERNSAPPSFLASVRRTSEDKVSILKASDVDMEDRTEKHDTNAIRAKVNKRLCCVII